MTATPATGGEGTDRGPRVLITGAAGGIGTAATAELRAQGASVVGVDLHGADIDCDVRDQASVDRAVAAAIERLGGGLDVLINNAGLGAPQSAGVAPDDDALDVLAVNRVGPWRVTSAALPALRASRGRVVNVASGLAHITAPFATAYTMSKRGVVAYSDSLRLEEGDRITVTTVYPGFIRTPIHARSTAAGVPLEGAVPAERVEDAARALARAALGPPVRDLATTRQGGVGYAFARLAPRRVLDKVTTLRMRKLARRGHFDAGGIAGEYAERLLQR
jgi:NAD(P)-dependent dehydrogenase (short-subunit alcohol dehydrogenase family)